MYPGDSASGVLLAQVEEWDPPVPMNTVLSQIDPAAFRIRGSIGTFETNSPVDVPALQRLIKDRTSETGLGR